jgi:hypothetical protein
MGLLATAAIASIASPMYANVTEIAAGVMMPVVSMGHSDSSTATSKQVAALWLSLGGRGLDTANSCEAELFAYDLFRHAELSVRSTHS